MVMFFVFKPTEIFLDGPTTTVLQKIHLKKVVNEQAEILGFIFFIKMRIVQTILIIYADKMCEIIFEKDFKRNLVLDTICFKCLKKYIF